ncbi:hypothetical protein EGI22_07660 [Lacihabitans sp. LS3-19]|uniref:hypothetical protein n=1 Tax=Lacihabitans sp. LS3-19 TaxID=2487335 RepID=UPI0020CE11B4|nr:hypothetical protein [Lacihabitans sp. LS3-19]MCP9767786.1 hypothetical protein [Lacihabitans sp. LS3-19]
MKKDIDFPQNQNVVLAIAPSEFEQWDVFLINNGSEEITNILVSSSGFGFDDKGEKVSTSTLRHFFDNLQGASFLAVEKIDPTVFHLNNEYWISYWIDGTLFDRRFLFVPDSITEQNCIQVSILDKSAVLHA